MGSARRWKPLRLSAKLRVIRRNLHLSQGEIVEALEAADRIDRRDISAFERGVREPPLPILLRYARLAKVSVETLIDDKLTLPAK
jgi:transcriptional regulator with XRE-family HTH domain